MLTYLYCLLTPADPACFPYGLRGLGEAPVRPLTAGAAGLRATIEAWVSTIAEPAESREADLPRDALVHHAVVQRALETGRTPLPARFGQHFADDASCRADITRREMVLAEALARVAGMVEMRVIVAPRHAARERVPAPALPASHAALPLAHPGRRYLEMLRTRAHEAAAVRARVAEQLNLVDAAVRHLAREMRRRDPGSAIPLHSGTTMHLVARESATAYRAALARITLSAEWRLVLADPAPPYNFSDLHS
ncbi:MAG TPA: GvpL/GvpF family gas vesicle protein [Gemmatimonadaceae bacterium]|nr:GvpL/GvpF family gas vesicle protein [Gemmatimonadaceae bacterium]